MSGGAIIGKVCEEAWPDCLHTLRLSARRWSRRSLRIFLNCIAEIYHAIQTYAKDHLATKYLTRNVMTSQAPIFFGRLTNQ